MKTIQYEITRYTKHTRKTNIIKPKNNHTFFAWRWNMYPFYALAWAAADAFESEVLKENG